MFCNYCKCPDHNDIPGSSYHAQTKDNTLICDICYEYNVCTDKNGKTSTPCDDLNCEHRPKLMSGWIKYN